MSWAHVCISSIEIKTDLKSIFDTPAFSFNLFFNLLLISFFSGLKEVGMSEFFLREIFDSCLVQTTQMAALGTLAAGEYLDRQEERDDELKAAQLQVEESNIVPEADLQ